MPRSAFFAVLLVALGIGLASCGAGKSRSGSDPALLTILVGFSTGNELGQRDLHRRLELEFNESHPDVRIQFLSINNDEYATKFNTLLADGNPPDLVMPIGAQGVAGAWDAWLNLASFVSRSEFEREDFYETVLNAQRHGDFIPSIPIGVYPSVLYYNADMFDRIRMPYPPKTFGEPGWTWDELIDRAQKLTRDKNGKITTDKGFDAEAINQFGWNGGDWSALTAQAASLGAEVPAIDKELKQAGFNSPAWKRALKFIKESIFVQQVRPRTTAGTTLRTFGDNDPMGSNRTAMWQGFSWMHYAWGAWNATLNWNVAAVPSFEGDRPVSVSNIEGLAIPKAAKNPELSWEVVVWLLKPETMRRLSEAYSCIPARKSLAPGWLVEQKKINKKVDWQVFLDAIEYMDVPSHEIWVPNYRKVWEAQEATLQGITDGTTRDTDNAAENLNILAQSYLDEYWKSR